MHRVTVSQTEPGGSWEAACRDCTFVEYGSTRKVARDEARWHRQHEATVTAIVGEDATETARAAISHALPRDPFEGLS